MSFVSFAKVRATRATLAPRTTSASFTPRQSRRSTKSRVRGRARKRAVHVSGRQCVIARPRDFIPLDECPPRPRTRAGAKKKLLPLEEEEEEEESESERSRVTRFATMRSKGVRSIGGSHCSKGFPERSSSVKEEVTVFHGTIAIVTPHRRSLSDFRWPSWANVRGPTRQSTKPSSLSSLRNSVTVRSASASSLAPESHSIGASTVKSSLSSTPPRRTRGPPTSRRFFRGGGSFSFAAAVLILEVVVPVLVVPVPVPVLVVPVPVPVPVVDEDFFFVARDDPRVLVRPPRPRPVVVRRPSSKKRALRPPTSTKAGFRSSLSVVLSVR